MLLNFQSRNAQTIGLIPIGSGIATRNAVSTLLAGLGNSQAPINPAHPWPGKKQGLAIASAAAALTD